MTQFYQRTLLAAAVLALATTFPVAAQSQKNAEKSHGAAEIKKDVADHRAMAEAHLTAAKCLESGKTEKECHAQLAKDCKGLAIGKYCGMQHRH
ncbi:MAG: hypothetical protein Q8L95_10725 [Burkholderiales bacterium]|nr:hypothetical protein [Burkholderiales bacterium]